MKLGSVDGRRFAFMKKFDIPDRRNPSQTYLRRWRVVQTPWFAIYLHRIFLPDSDRDPHDHPYVFHSFILSGGYTEMIYNPSGAAFARRSRWSLHRMSLQWAHKILAVKPNTWTLLLVGRRVRDWGFWVDGDPTLWQQWQQYLLVEEGRTA